MDEAATPTLGVTTVMLVVIDGVGVTESVGVPEAARMGASDEPVSMLTAGAVMVLFEKVGLPTVEMETLDGEVAGSTTVVGAVDALEAAYVRAVAVVSTTGGTPLGVIVVVMEPEGEEMG